MIKTILAVAVMIPLSGPMAFANAAADTDAGLEGCPEMTYVNGRPTIIQPAGETPAEQASIAHCPKSKTLLGHAAEPPAH